jgi:hypothetical protein
MPKKPFSLRSMQCTHIKYAKKMEKFDREVTFSKSRKSVYSVRGGEIKNKLPSKQPT